VVLKIEANRVFFFSLFIDLFLSSCSVFNSGVMVIEPSMCMFKELMEEIFKLGSYNGGNQGFLNEVFPWWHRLPTKQTASKSSRQHRI
jgi:hypothetical protein